MGLGGRLFVFRFLFFLIAVLFISIDKGVFLPDTQLRFDLLLKS